MSVQPIDDPTAGVDIFVLARFFRQNYIIRENAVYVFNDRRLGTLIHFRNKIMMLLRFGSEGPSRILP